MRHGSNSARASFESAVEFWLLVAAVLLVSHGIWGWIVAGYLAVRSVERLVDGFALRDSLRRHVHCIDLTGIPGLRFPVEPRAQSKGTGRDGSRHGRRIEN